MRTIGWYREQWAKERWKLFCAVWGQIGWAATVKEQRDVMCLEIDCGASPFMEDYIYDRGNWSWEDGE